MRKKEKLSKENMFAQKMRKKEKLSKENMFVQKMQKKRKPFKKKHAQVKDAIRGGKFQKAKYVHALFKVEDRNANEAKNLYMVSVIERLLNVLKRNYKFKKYLADFYKKEDVYAEELDLKNVSKENICEFWFKGRFGPNIDMFTEDIKKVISNKEFIEDIKKPIDERYFNELKKKMLGSIKKRNERLKGKLRELKLGVNFEKDYGEAQRKRDISFLKKFKKDLAKIKIKEKLNAKDRERKRHLEKCIREIKHNLKVKKHYFKVGKQRKLDLIEGWTEALANYKKRLEKLERLSFKEYLVESKKISLSYSKPYKVVTESKL